MKQTPPAPPRHQTHTHTGSRALVRPASQPPCPGRDPLCTNSRGPGRAGSAPPAAQRPPASSRLCPPRAARRPGGAPGGRPARAQAAHPAPARPAGLGQRQRADCSGSRGRRRGREPRRRSAPSAPSFCGSGGSRGAPPEPPEAASRARPGPGRRAPSEGGAGRGRATALALPCCCPACVPAFVLVATTAPYSDPVSVPASAQPSRLGPEGPRGGLPTGFARWRRERAGSGGAELDHRGSLERREGSAPVYGAGWGKGSIAQDQMGRGCLREGGAWEGEVRGAGTPESRGTERERSGSSESRGATQHPAPVKFQTL